MAKKRILYNSIEAIRQAWGKISIPDIQAFISTAQYDPGLMKDADRKAEWMRKYHCQTLMEADKKKKTSIEASDFRHLADYWVNEFVFMDNKVRSSILADVLNVLHTYNMGIAREMVSTTTTVSPSDMERGKFVLVDFPIDEHGESGKIIMNGWKYLTQKFILRREVCPGDSVICIHADEAQECVSSFDAAFLAKCRSHLGCMIYLTQSYHSYFSGDISEHRVRAFLTNFGHKIFHTIGDGETAQYASSLLGKRREVFITVSPKSGLTMGEEIFGEAGVSCSINEAYQEVLQPIAFLSGLRSGGPGNDRMVDGIVIRSGEPFRNGENWQFVSFKQT